MKLAKLSLAAVVAMSMSAMATDLGGLKDVKVTGMAKLWYQTSDVKHMNNDLFNKDSAIGQGMLKVGITAGYGDALGFGVTGVAIDTLGLENNLVSGVTVGRTTDTQSFAQEAYITYAMGNTLAKIGRQKLDTPLAFSESWNIVENSFDAAVLINSDLPDTTLIAAYVGKGNGQTGELFGGATTVGQVAADLTAAGVPLTAPAVMSALGTFYGYGAGGSTISTDGKFYNYVTDGAYAVAVLNKSIPMVPLNFWYYNVSDVADAFWIDTDVALPVDGVKLGLGLQYGYVEASGLTEAALNAVGATDVETDAFGVKLHGAMDAMTGYLAYSDVSKGALPVANTATGFKKTKLFTASIFSDGTIAARPDYESLKVGVGYSIYGVKMDLSYGTYENGSNSANDVEEIDFVVGTKVADFDLKAMYINRDWDQKHTVGDEDRIRIILSYAF